MSIGASLNTVFNSAVADSTHHIEGGRRFGNWRLLLGGLLGTLLLSAAAHANSVNIAQSSPNASPEVMDLVRPIEDGVYFYGSAPQPDEIGNAYLVFEAQDSNIVGAIFMPHSSFDCFKGQVSGNELALQIRNSYTQEMYDYAIALVSTSDPIASVGTPEVPLQLDGFHDLGAPRDAEATILATCQSNMLPAAEVEL